MEFREEGAALIEENKAEVMGLGRWVDPPAWFDVEW